MQLKQLINDDDAVSPVIGVILMVAITVILAAVIGTFVLGLGENVQSTTPQASFGFDFSDTGSGSDDVLTVSHKGGDTVTDSQLSVKYSGVDTDSGLATLASGSFQWGTSNADVSAGDQISAAQDIKTAESMGGSTYIDMNGATVRVTWSGESGDNSAVLGEWSGPAA